MKKKFSKLFLCFVLLGSGSACFAQRDKMDSLLLLLKTDGEDTVKVIHLNVLARQYIGLGYYDSTSAFANAALKISWQLHPVYKRGVSNAYNILGIVDIDKGNYPRAIDFFLKALKIDEELGDKKAIAARLGNIGNVYLNQAEYNKALDYFFRSLKMREELGAKNLVAVTLGNIGSTYYQLKDYDKALNYLLIALKKDEELGNKSGSVRHICNIANIYADRKNYAEALKYYFNALKIDEELEDKTSIAVILGNVSLVYIDQKQYNNGFNYVYRALALSDSIGAMNYVMQWYEMLSQLYEKSNISLHDSMGGKLLNAEQMRLRALYYHKRYIAVRDTLFSEENKKELVRKEMNFEFEKKETEAKAEQDKKDAVAAADAKRQKMVLILVSFVLVLVAVVAFIIFRSLRITKRQKMLIEEQKYLVEEKQKEILDSIYYARRIQRSLLPSEKYIERSIKSLIK